MGSSPDWCRDVHQRTGNDSIYYSYFHVEESKTLTNCIYIGHCDYIVSYPLIVYYNMEVSLVVISEFPVGFFCSPHCVSLSLYLWFYSIELCFKLSHMVPFVFSFLGFVFWLEGQEVLIMASISLSDQGPKTEGGGGGESSETVAASDQTLLYRGFKKAKKERGSIYRGVTRYCGCVSSKLNRCLRSGWGWCDSFWISYCVIWRIKLRTVVMSLLDWERCCVIWNRWLFWQLSCLIETRTECIVLHSSRRCWGVLFLEFL